MAHFLGLFSALYEAGRRTDSRAVWPLTRKSIEIDRDKLRAEIRKLGNEYILCMLDDAIDLLPPTELYNIAKKYLDLKRLRPNAEKAHRRACLRT